jgi:hypothetical protein
VSLETGLTGNYSPCNWTPLRQEKYRQVVRGSTKETNIEREKNLMAKGVCQVSRIK